MTWGRDGEFRVPPTRIPLPVSPTDDELDAAGKQATESMERLAALIESNERMRVERGREWPSGKVGQTPSREAAPLTIEMMPWASHGLCRTANGDWMEVPTFQWKKQREAKAVEIAICDACPVEDECLEHALTFNETHGVWGGRVPKERQVMRQRRKRDAK